MFHCAVQLPHLKNTSSSNHAAWVLKHNVEELLPLPLSEVRRRLNIAEPEIYNSVPDDIKQNLLKPKISETQSERERSRIKQAHA